MSLAVGNADCTTVKAAAGRRMAESFPSFFSAAGEVRPAGTVPLSFLDLQAAHPTLDAAAPLCRAGILAVLATVVRHYGPGVVRSIASATHRYLLNFVPQLSSAQTIGDWNVAAVQLLWLDSTAVDGALLLC